MDSLKEIQGKTAHDPYSTNKMMRCVFVNGPVIVGAGPSGLAAAACLTQKGVPSLVLERSNCIASLWQLKTYDRLRLHLPKQFCELPLMSFPDDFPTYPTKQQFIKYLELYAMTFDIRPVFNQTVVCANYDRNLALWRVRTETRTTRVLTAEYVTRWLIVATGENAEAVVPGIEGMDEFGGSIMHTSLYKSGEIFRGKKVLVVGCGNSGMEVCLDLCNHDASPSLVVRDTVRTHILFIINLFLKFCVHSPFFGGFLLIWVLLGHFKAN